MPENALLALNHALSKDISLAKGKTLVINPAGTIGLEGDVTALQGFKPLYDLLKENTTWHLKNSWSDLETGYDTAILLLPKQKDQARGWIARAYQHLKPQGLLICALANKAGGASIVKQHPKAHHVSKHKARVLWGPKEIFLEDEKADKWITESCAQAHSKTNLQAAPGMFSWRRPDNGSLLLLEYLPDKLKGKGADFCSGYGYLAHQILKSGRACSITCVEADFAALELSQQNLNTFEDISFEWLDLTTQRPQNAPFDWIVMNPPFHEDISQSKAIGQACIQTAAKSLKKNGLLYMVANKHLPYEKTISSLFSSHEKCAEKNGFKIFKAVL